MSAVPSRSLRCQPVDLLQLLSPGIVTGLYLASPWIDWSAPLPGSLQVVVPWQPCPMAGIRSDAFHLVMDQGNLPPHAKALIEGLTGASLGVAVASARAGALLRLAHRVITLPFYPQRSAGPFRARPSGVLRLVRETALRILERSQVLDSAMLSLRVADPARAGQALQPLCSEVVAERNVLHLRLRGLNPEEVLGRLLAERIAVHGSAQWYRQLQPPPPLAVPVYLHHGPASTML